MALIKAINFKGFTPEFWVITSKTDNLFDNTTRATVSLYKDRATCVADKSAAIVTLTWTMAGVNKSRADIEDYILVENFDGAPVTDAILLDSAVPQIDPDFTSPVDNYIIPNA